MSNCLIDPLLNYNTGEAWFCLDDHVNIQYNRHWSVYDHRLMHDVPFTRRYIWSMTSATRIIGKLSFSKIRRVQYSCIFYFFIFFFKFKRWGEGLRILPARWYNRPYTFQGDSCLTEILEGTNNSPFLLACWIARPNHMWQLTIGKSEIQRILKQYKHTGRT
jgi:hypothetical protein